MAIDDPYAQYRENQLTTVTPGKTLVMAYDAAIRFARTASERMKEGKLDEQSANIRKAQNIIVEFMSTLDMRHDRRLAANLYGIYSYMFDRLTQASIRDDAGALSEAITMLTELRDTWAEAERLVRSGERAAA